MVVTGLHSTENSNGREPVISGAGDPLVLLHGWAMSSAVWEPILEKLQSNWKLYRINLPGHGGRGYCKTAGGLDNWLDDVMAFAPAKATWLGWSLGGLLAMAAASRYPERVQRLILVATTPKFTLSDDWRVAGDETTWRAFDRGFRENTNVANRRFLTVQALGSARPKRLINQLAQLQLQGGKADNAALSLGLEILLNTDLRQELEQIHCPVHWLLGEGDRLVPDEVAKAIKRLLPHCQLHVIAAAGHVPFLSRPDRFMEIIRAL